VKRAWRLFPIEEENGFSPPSGKPLQALAQHHLLAEGKKLGNGQDGSFHLQPGQDSGDVPRDPRRGMPPESSRNLFELQHFS